jgi:hypothetical protein
MYSRKDFLGTLLKAGALVGAGGMLTLGERSALAAQIESLYFEAESMSFSSLSGISVVSDSRANGGRVLMMTTESSAFKNNVTFWGAANEVRIMVRAQSSGASWPVVAILVDGREVGRWTIISTEADPYQLPSALISQAIPAGRHNVELRAVSGMSGSGTLWVDFIQFRRPEPQQPPPSGTVYFEDGFDRDADTFTNWDRVHVMNITATTDPTVKRSGTHGLKLSVQDINSNTFGWSGVRSHIVKENLFTQGTERYIGWSIYIPADHPIVKTWHTLFQFGYTGGYKPSNYVGLRPDGRLKLEGDWTDPLPVLKWVSSIPVRGAWHDVVFRVYSHRDPRQGFVEIWLDGIQQTMANGNNRIYYSTINPNQPIADSTHLHVCNYRDRGQYQWSTVYHDSVKVGSTYDIVDPAG